MKKPVKLLGYLLISAAILFFLWVRADCPRLTAQGALNRIESVHLAPKSQLISAQFLHQLTHDGVNYRRHMAAGLTNTHLHIAEVRKGAWLWHGSDRLYQPLLSLPLEDGPMTGLAPDYWPFDHTFFLYTPQPVELWVATLTMGDQTYTTEGACDPSGFTLFTFDQLENCSEEENNNLKAYVYDMLHMGYDKTTKYQDVTLEVTLYPHIGEEPVRVVTEYPANK